MKLSIVFQAGGSSSRMGSDKGLLEFQGATMIDHILEQIKGLGDETLIISNNPSAYSQFGYPVFEDVYPGMGALGGIYSAIFHSKYEYTLLLACDMPFVNLPFTKYLLSYSSEYDAVIPVWEEGKYPEPFRAIYSKACLAPIKRSLDSGILRIRDFFDQINVKYIGRNEIVEYDPEGYSFFNVNHPEELVLAEEIAEKIKSLG